MSTANVATPDTPENSEHTNEVSLGGIIRKRRCELGMSMRKLGGQLGVSYQSISNIETGKTRFIGDDAKFTRLCEILNLNSIELRPLRTRNKQKVKSRNTPLGQFITEERSRKKMTQQALAGIAKISTQVLNHIETGLKNPSPNILEKLSNALNCKIPDNIVTKTAEKQPKSRSTDENIRFFMDKYYLVREILVIMGKGVFENCKPSKIGLTMEITRVLQKSMKKIGFGGKIEDFLRHLSLLFIQYNWMSCFHAVCTRKIDPIASFTTEESKLRFCLMELAETCLRFKEDSRNMLKLSMANPEYFFNSMFYIQFTKEFGRHSKEDLNMLCYKILSLMHYASSFHNDENEIVASLKNELRGLSKQKLSFCKDFPPEKTFELLPREKMVADGIAGYLSEKGGDEISKAKKTLWEYFTRKRIAICEATIFHAIKGLEELGLLKDVTDKDVTTRSNIAFTYRFNKELYENSRIIIKPGLPRTSASKSSRMKKKK